MSLVRQAAQEYGRHLKTRPIITKSLTSFTLMLGADWVVQKSEGDTFDAARSLRFSSFGLFFGVAGHTWYSFAQRFFAPQSSVAGLVKTVCVDQGIFAPAVTAALLAYVTILEGKEIEDVPPKLFAELPRTVVHGWALWVPVQFANFRLVPESYRVPVASGVAFLWNIYMAVVANRPLPDEDTVIAETASNAVPSAKISSQRVELPFK